jgi:hypothetical protein
MKKDIRYGRRWLERLKTQARFLLRDIREVRKLLPLLLRRPAIAGHCVTSACRHHVALLAAVIVVLIAAPYIVDFTAKHLHPPKKTLFGLVTQPEGSTPQTRKVVLGGLWIVSCGWIALAIWLHIPAGALDAARRSRRLELEADAVADYLPHRKAALYRKALALTSNPEQEVQLKHKIRILGSSPSSSRIADQTAVTGIDASGQFTSFQPQPGSEYHAKIDGPKSIGRDGRYRVDTELGHGGMGIVYRGYDTVLGRHVALKGLPVGLARDEAFVSRFQQEARALALLSHPCIVHVYDFVKDQGRFWMVLELIDNGDLTAYLKTHGRLQIAEAIRLGTQLARALAYAHKQGVVHRDFKPSNVLLTTAGTPKITDFGLAKLMGSTSQTQSGTILGSAPYMSPEQAAGKPADERSDVYALGITLYEMATGRTPFEGDTASLLAQHITQTPPPPHELCAEIPLGLEALILSMLAKDPDKRTRDLEAVARQLAVMAKGLGHEVAPVV